MGVSAEAFERAPWSALRERLRAARYDDSILGWAEAIAPGAPDAVRLPVVQWNLERRGDPCARAATLFAYDGALDRAAARELLGGELVASLEAAGVLVDDSGQVRSALRVLPVADLYALGDGPGGGADAVMPPGPTTLQLVRLLPDSVQGAVLDVGCASGTLALAAARRGAARAVGVDVSARAIAAARACARLNDVACELREGDLTAPVRGERFDLVLAQPPYVVRPPESRAITFLHGGACGDEIALRLLSELPGVLAPGGLALVLFDAPVRKAEPLHALVRAALGDATLDVAILAAPGLPLDVQACGYASLEEPELGARYAELARRYREHLATMRIASIAHALVIVRAREGGGTTVTLPVGRIPAGPDAVRELWESIDLAALPDAALLHARVRASPHARWIEERESPSDVAPPARRVRFDAASRAPDHELSEAAMAMLASLDVSDSIDEAIARYAVLCEATPDEVRGQALAFVREALARGALVSAPRHRFG